MALNYLREQCGDAEAFLAPEDLPVIYDCYGWEIMDAPQLQVTCARLRGQTAEQIRTTMTAELAAVPCTDTGDNCCDEGPATLERLVSLAENVDVTVSLGPDP